LQKSKNNCKIKLVIWIIEKLIMSEVKQATRTRKIKGMSPFPTILPLDDTAPTSVQEQIGSQRRFLFRFRSPWDRWKDINLADYKFWDKARRGKAQGLELSGLFLRALSSKISSWAIGKTPLWHTQNSTATQSLIQWWNLQQSKIVLAYQEALDLADCYLVFNGDSSLTVVSPDFVDKIREEGNPANIIGYRITTTYTDELNEKNTVTYINEYYANYRYERRERFSGTPFFERTYRNPMGRIPVIHIRNRFGADEENGRPLGEPLLPLLIRYGDVFDAALKGNIRQGRPTPTINKMGTAAQVDEFWERYGSTEVRHNPDGSTEEMAVINFDPDMLLTLGGDAQFKYEAPGSFVGDTEKLLALLFFLLVQHSEVAEFTLGVAIGASKASAESQLEPFIRFIEKMQMMTMEWVLPLAELYLSWLGTFDVSARGAGTPNAIWKPMSAAQARLVLDTLIWMFAKKTIDPELMTWLTPLNFSNPTIVQERAEDYWGDSYATPAAVGTGVPSSGGEGDQEDQFNRIENPLQPTERESDAQVDLEQHLVEQNGHRKEPIPEPI
jgi:hypothetical protein